MKWGLKMNLEIHEVELLVETIEYRIENDVELIRDVNTKEDLTYLLERLEDEYV